MIYKQIHTFWSGLASREQMLLVLLIAVIILGLSFSWLLANSSNISTNSKLIKQEKANFEYVLGKATNYSTFLTQQQLEVNFPDLPSYLETTFSKLKISNFNLEIAMEKNILTFTDPSLMKITQFLDEISSHPSLRIEVIDISTSSEIYSVRIEYTEI